MQLAADILANLAGAVGPEEAESAAMVKLQSANVLSQKKCPSCGAKKPRKQAFCMGCYYTLPRGMRQTLYAKVGQGFEAAYRRALDWLRKVAEEPAA